MEQIIATELEGKEIKMVSVQESGDNLKLSVNFNDGCLVAVFSKGNSLVQTFNYNADGIKNIISPDHFKNARTGTASMQLEETILNLAEQHLKELADCKSNEAFKGDCLNRFFELKGLTQLGLLAETGLSEKAAEVLIKIDEESNAIFSEITEGNSLTLVIEDDNSIYSAEPVSSIEDAEKKQNHLLVRIVQYVWS